MIKSRARALAKDAPMAHQKESLKHDRISPEVFDASDPGTGKTAVRIWAFAERRRRGGGCFLVLAPRTLLRTAWANDFKRFAPDMRVSVASAENRVAAFDANADVYVTNHDAVKDLAKRPKKFWEKFSEICADESTAFKHHTSQRSRSALKIFRMSSFDRRSILTATPTSNGITDIHHQVLLLDGGKRLGPSFYAFRNSVAEPEQMSRFNKNAVKWHDKEGAEEAVYGLLNSIVIRHKRDDCIDIPATHTYTQEYELPKKQRQVYNAMAEAQLLVLKKTKLTAINAAAVATKLLQIASGAVYDNDGVPHLVDAGRYELLMDMVEARTHPVLFFYWKHQRDALIAQATKRGLKYGVLDGEASDRSRSELVLGYQAGVFDVLLAHPKSAAHGLTLTKGTSIIWSGPTYDLEWFKQGNMRQARIGQTKKTEVVTVIATDTIDRKVYDEILVPKGERMGTLLDLFDFRPVKSRDVARALEKA